jgi:photosystem II stability/assembly factor-like uncharacterized protein
MRSLRILATCVLGMGCGSRAVEPAPPVGLRFVAEPMSSTAGATLDPVQVAIVDDTGMVVVSAAGAISLALDQRATLAGTTSAQASGGIATFADLSITKASGGYHLVASASGLADATSAALDIAAAAPDPVGSSLAVSPSTQVVGMPATVMVTLLDAFGNPAPGQAVVLSASGSMNTFSQPAATDGTGSTSGTITSTVAEAKTISASVGATALAQSVGVTFQPGPPAGLAFVTQPSAVRPGVAITPPVQVSARDAYGNLTAGLTGNVTIALAADPVCADVYHSSVAATGGVASFPDLELEIGGKGFSLMAYATVGGTPIGGASNSFDVGPAAWNDISGPYGFYFSKVVFSPTQTSTMYAVNRRDGLVKTTDSGSTWSTLPLPDRCIVDVAIDPNDGSVWALAGSGLYKSTNAGASWSAIASLPPEPTTALAIDPSSAIYVVGQSTVRKSADGGASWTALNTSASAPPYWVAGVVVAKTSPVTLYFYSPGNGVLMSTDGGATWSAINTGLTDLNVNTVVVDPSTPTTVYAGASTNGLFKRVAGGSWSPSPVTGSGANIAAIAVSPVDSTHVWVESYPRTGPGWGGDPNGGIFASTNGGSSWARVNTVMHMGHAMIADAASPTNLFLATGEGAVFRSSDGGATWAPTMPGLTGRRLQAMAVGRASATTVYVAGFSTGVFVTTDAGANWSSVNSGLPTTDITALAVDPAGDSTVYVGTNGFGVYKTTNGGGAWSSIGLAADSITALLATSTTLFAGTKANGLRYTTNSGTSWSIATGQTSGFYPEAIAADPTTATTMYMGGNATGGFFKSTDGGATWKDSGNGMGNMEGAKQIAVDPTNPMQLYVGTYAGSSPAFTSSDGAASWTQLTSLVTIYSMTIDAQGTVFVVASHSTGQTGPLGMVRSTDHGASWSFAGSGFGGGDALAVSPANSLYVYASGGDGVHLTTNGGL